MLRASSMLTAMIFTPVCFCHSAYFSLMVLSSRLHGAHHVAQKLMIMGLPPLLQVEVFTFLPSRPCTVTEGSLPLCADNNKGRATEKAARRRFMMSMIEWDGRCSKPQAKEKAGGRIAVAVVRRPLVF